VTHTSGKTRGTSLAFHIVTKFYIYRSGNGKAHKVSTDQEDFTAMPCGICHRNSFR